MGTDDDYLSGREDSERRWEYAAKKNNYRCSVCGEIPNFDERGTYFDTGMCGRCDFRADKDD